MENVLILLSTFNGEKFIKKQLRSILEQDYAGNIHILIRDDGSTDRTRSIIEEFRCECEEINHRSIELHAGKNVGPGRSFLRLINKCRKADFYFFADQDDIWDADKVRVAVGAININEPILYSCAYRVVDRNERVTLQRSVHTPGWDKPLRALFYSESLGCSMAMNSKMMAIVKSYHFDHCMMHDNLVMLIALLKGKVIYDEKPHFCYRIHGANSQGLSPRKKAPKAWVREKMNLFLHGEDYDLCKTADQLLRSGIRKEYQMDMILLRDHKKNPEKKIKLLLHKDMSPDKPLRWRISVICHILFNLY